MLTAIVLLFCAGADGAPRELMAPEQAKKIFARVAVDGWLLTDFRGANPIAQSILRPRGLQTRRWFALVMRDGRTKLLLHKIEAANFEAVGGERRLYAERKAQDAGLKWLLAGVRRVAMEYSPEAALPYISRVDAGTVERVRGLGVKVVSSEILVQRQLSRLSPAGIESHRRAAAVLARVKDAAFARIRAATASGEAISEWGLSKWMAAEMTKAGLESDGEPIVAVNAHAGNPHYSPDDKHDASIRRGDLVLLDLWGKEKARADSGANRGPSIYADITWMGFIGDEVPAKFAKAFELVTRARDAVLGRLRARPRASGAQLDRVSRAIIERAGQGAFFIHRTGHSIDEECHGSGAHLDSYETNDTRVVEEGSLFSVEPGLYYNDFGVRSEINVFIGPGGRIETTTGEPQRTIVPVLK